MEWPRPKAQAPPKRLAGAALKAQQRVQNSQAMFAKGKGKGGKGKGKGPRKAPRGAAQQSLLKRASLNAANAVRAHTPGAASPTADYPFGGFPEDPAFDFLGSSLKRKREDEFDDDDAEGSIDPGSERDGEGSIVDPDPDDPMDDDPDGSDDDGEGELEDDEPHFDLASTEPGALPPPAPVAAFSKEAEIEKLRTSGSMTQSVSEVARVKNLNRLQIGAHEVDAWYFSPYPREYAHLPVLYLCEFCLSYFPSSFMLGRHRKRCTLLHPPGNEIYRHEDISFYELDGKRQLQYCRNLSLLSKCFLDQ
jgi:histone acetyltransferase HTATIP